MGLIGPLADGGTPDQGVSAFLIVAAVLLGWFAVWRLRGRAFLGMPKALAWAAGGLAAASVVLAFVLPPIIRPIPASTRPSTTARLRIEQPTPGEVFLGNPATVDVRLRLTGGRIVPFTSRTLVPNEGHVHVYVDGALVSMTFALDDVLRVSPGRHRLMAEFVAVDHAPFRPRVESTVSFDVRA